MDMSSRAPERGRLGSLTDNKDDDLALFREMRKCENERNNIFFQNREELDTPLGPRVGSSPIFHIAAGTSSPVQMNGAADFFSSDNDKNDYDWLLTPPGTPLFPSLEESHKTVMSHLETSKAQPTSLRLRLAKPLSEPAERSNPSRNLCMLNTSSGGLRRPPSAGGSGPRSATPIGLSVLSSNSGSTLTTRSTLTPASNKHALPAIEKPSMGMPSKSASTAVSKPSRSTTPISRMKMLPGSSIVPPRSSTPTSRPIVRSSTPTSRSSVPTTKTISKAPTSSCRPAAFSNVTSTAAVKSAASYKQPHAQVEVSSLARSNSQNVRPRPPWKPSEMPGFSLDAPQNLRTTLPERPPSANRGRAGAPSSRSSSVEPVPNGRIRRQSCSPARGRPPNRASHSSGSSVPVPVVNRLHAKANDTVSPVVVGNKMVERVINMRKLVPPKQYDRPSTLSNLNGKSSSPDSSGFGRMLSKKSLDMAIRHMDIRRAIPGNPRSPMSNISASSKHCLTPVGTRKTVSVSGSPLATSSNASSERSVNNYGLCGTGPELDDGVTSDKGIPSSASRRGRRP